MAEKILNTRILNKYDSLSKWSDSSLVLKKGEIAFSYVEAKDNSGDTYVPTVLMKVGDGEKTFAQLPWTAAKASDVYPWAKKENPTIDELPDNLKTAITNLQDAVGEGGSVADAIADAINALDVNAVTTGKGQIIGSISQVDGKIVVTPRDLNADDIPVIAIAQVDGLEAAIADAKKAGTDASDALNTYKGEMVTALAGKQDVIPENTYDAYGSAAQALSDAKAYVDEQNHEDTQYGIEYDTVTKKIKLVSDTSKTEIDATAFIKDGMIESVALSEDGLNLVITWNTDAGKENSVTTIPLSGLVDVYTGVNGTTVNVAVSSDNKVSAEVNTGSIKDGHIAADAAIAKSKLADDVQASLGLADSAIQEDDLGTMAKEAADDYVKKADATGYTDILTKTEAATTYATVAQGALADSAVQTVSTPAAANGEPNGLKAVKTGSDVAISLDETVTWVFDCGDSSDVTNA